jgi:uncharacterized membrane protein
MDDFDLYRLFKTLHVISIVILGGGFVMEALAGILVSRAKTVLEVRAYAHLIYISENYVSLIAALAIVVFGYLTANFGDLDLGSTWLLLGQILFYAIAVLAIVFLRPAANQLHQLAQTSPDGPVTQELSAQLQKPVAAIVGAVTSVMFAFVIYLMVVKPAW